MGPPPLAALSLGALLVLDPQSDQLVNLPGDLLVKYEIASRQFRLLHRVHPSPPLPPLLPAHLCLRVDGSLDVTNTLYRYMHGLDRSRQFAVCVVHSLEQRLNELWTQMTLDERRELWMNEELEVVRVVALMLGSRPLSGDWAARTAAIHGCTAVLRQTLNLPDISEDLVAHLVIIMVERGHKQLLNVLNPLVVDLSAGFCHRFPDGRVPIAFFKRLREFDAFGQEIARQLLNWLPSMERLRIREAISSREEPMLESLFHDQ